MIRKGTSGMSLRNYVMLLILNAIGERRRKWGFITSLSECAKVLDVGCGNNSPYKTKRIRPDLYYYGLDVEDYYQDLKSKEVADEYRMSSPELFSEAIRSIPMKFDGVISNHNIEHCCYPIDTLDAMCEKVCQGGYLFLCFPCEESVSFPSRKGTLCFFDDKTHIWLPDYNQILRRIAKNGFVIKYTTRHYRPAIKVIIGKINNYFNKDSIRLGIWELYGFESIVWAQKK